MPEVTRRATVPHALSEINITPLVDVMLVLLIIFMVVTPLAQRGLDVALPPPADGTERPQPRDPFVLTLERGPDGSVVASLDRHPLAMRDLASRLFEIYGTLPDKTLFVRVDGSLRYGQAVAALDVARGAGVERIGLLAGPEVAAAR